MWRIFHKPRTHKQRLRAATASQEIVFERKELPGAGAGQYAFETFGLPVYGMYGRGNINVTNPLRATSPFSYAYHAVGIAGVPPVGQLQGQFMTQPLMNVDAAQAIGVVSAPGTTPGQFNQIPVGG